MHAASENPAGLPLRDITVVAIEQAVAVPFATRQLADLGARVIKIERPDGGDFARGYDHAAGGQSSYFVWLNRGKQSLTLDLKDAAGVDIVHRLLARADVFVQNLAPGAARRLGLDAATVVARHRQLVAGDLSGYGTGGPFAGRKAYDLLIQCEAGLVSLTGPPEAPARSGVSVADIAGGMYLLTGVLAALRDRERSGRGRSFEVSLLDSLGEWMGQPAHHTEGTGEPPPRTGLAHPTIAPYGPYPTSDGTVVIAVQNDREWRRLCADLLHDPTVADRSGLRTNAQRVANRDQLDQLIRAASSRLDSDQLIAVLDAAAIANARVNSVADLLHHPQLVARERWSVVDTPTGTARALAPPVIYHHSAQPPMAAVPGLGEHTSALLTELGLDPAEIAGLHQRGVA
ncbi:MAG: CoA transferase [Micromonosporaceae bacterium]|nr:CoA transferase [Micromonosporaceae bacterium]